MVKTQVVNFALVSYCGADRITLIQVSCRRSSAFCLSPVKRRMKLKTAVR